MLASLLRKVFQPPKEKEDTGTLSKSTSNGSLASQGSELFTGREGPITLSNDDPNEDKLNGLLSTGFAAAESAQDDSFLSDGSNNQTFADDVKVDVTLRTQLGQAPALMLLITAPGQNVGPSVYEPARISLVCEVGLNGRVTVVDSAGLVKAEGGEGGDTEMQGAQDSGAELQVTHKKIARVLEISQDLGFLVEWVLRWLRERAGSG